MAITKAQMESLLSELESIGPPADEERVLSKKEVEDMLRPVVKKMRAYGYTPDQIQQLLGRYELSLSKSKINEVTKRRKKTQAKSASSSDKRTERKGNNSSKKNQSVSAPTHTNESTIKEHSQPAATSTNSGNFIPDDDLENL